MPRDYDDRDRPRRRAPDDAHPPSKGSVVLVAGIVGGVGVLLLVGLLVGLVLMSGKGKDQAGRREVGNNAHQIAIGVHIFNDTYDRTGNPFAQDRGGFVGKPPALTPTQRLSWRADLLPYIEQGYLYNSLNTSQAWDSPTNSPSTFSTVRTYLDPADPADHQTRFRAFYDNGAVWDSKTGYRMNIGRIPDGSSNTILFVDAADRGPWAQFNELKFDPNGTLPELGHPQRTAFVAAMADGSVKWVKKSISPATLKAAIHASDGPPGSEFDK